MQASISVSSAPAVQYLLRIGDTCLMQAQRLGEWCGHAPALEEDIALSNMALDLLGQARAVLTRAGQLEGEQPGGTAHDEDQLAYLRDERDYRNLTLAELPRGDFAVAVVRNLLLASWFKALWTRLLASSDAELAAIAGKAVKEVRYHQQHAAEWAIRLGDGTEESAGRMRAALDQLWPYSKELFIDDAVDEHAAVSGLGPRSSELREEWLADIDQVLQGAGLTRPADGRFVSTGKSGRHSEHLGYLLADLQYLQRSFPQGAW